MLKQPIRFVVGHIINDALLTTSRLVDLTVPMEVRSMCLLRSLLHRIILGPTVLLYLG